MSGIANRAAIDEDCSEVMAAIDLGSNSFHMIIARVCGADIQVLKRDRDMVRLAGGLNEEGQLSDEVQARAIKTLAKFRTKLKPIPSRNIRAVGTNTLRTARNGPKFLIKAQEALDHPIRIISGPEEARLIYLGVAHAAPAYEGRRLVVDIGGGSTELILGERRQPLDLTSIPMGCVTFTRRFFPDGEITPTAMDRAQDAACQAVREFLPTFGKGNWQRAVGSSGTIKSIRKLLKGMGAKGESIHSDALKRLRQSILDFGHVQQMAFRGLDPERSPILPAGVAILAAMFVVLEIEIMQVSKCALREGLLHEMILERD